MNRRVLMALAISAGMALLVSAVFYQVAVRNRAAPTEQTEMKEIVVPAKDLEIGATIVASDLKLSAWPANKIPTDSVTEMDQLVDRVPISRLLAEEPVSARRLADAGSGAGLSSKVPLGMRAMSVRVNDVIGVSGFVLPEARVDVLVTGTPRNGDMGQMTKTILSNVRVISAGENLEPDASGRPQRVVVTLLVTPDQAELLTLASTQGRLQMVLRNSRDEGVEQTRGVQEPQLFTSLVQEPKPPSQRPRPAARPMAQLAPPPPPPPPLEVEMIRGNERSVATFDREVRAQ